MESAVAAPARLGSRISGRALRCLLWLAAAAALAVGLRLTVLRPARVPVTVFRAAAGRVEESVTNSKAGTVKSRRRAELSPEIGGRVRELPAKKGARVRQGDVLMRIADGDYRAQVDVQQSALDASVSARVETCRTAEQLDRELARNQALSREKLVSVEWLDQLQSRRDAAAAACETARARIGQARAGARRGAGQPREDGAPGALRRRRRRGEDRGRRVDHAVAAGPSDPAGPGAPRRGVDAT